MTDFKSWGQLVRQYRKAQKLTQGDLAAACGVGVRFIVELEKGKPTCEVAKVIRVTQLLGLQLWAH
ncbi:MAG: helix-turn-helix transcriptional regulator [Cyanobacteria bacterium]|nr:helix-turn-helix transcriptional regulator [Cyanobacteriota bacterium]